MLLLLLLLLWNVDLLDMFIALSRMHATVHTRFIIGLHK